MKTKVKKFRVIAKIAQKIACLTACFAFSASAASVAKVGDTEYETLGMAFAALSSENYTLTLQDTAAWPAETPVYWAAGTQSGFATTLTEALTAAYKANAGAITIVCRPGADVGTMTHGHVADDLTIYGNKAYLSGGECDLEVDQYKFSRVTGAQATDGAYLEKDITITAYELDNLGVWGDRHTAHMVTVNLTDCDGKGTDFNGKGNPQRVYILGTTGVNNITLTGCDFLTKATAVYSNVDGAIKAVNCSFTGGQVPFNINHKANGKQTVTVENCTFTKCGDDGDWKQFAAPIRLVNSGTGTMAAAVTKCEFAGTVGANGDILLGDGRTGQASNDVALEVTDTKANIQAQKPGYYGGETVDETKKTTAESPAEGTLETSVAKLLPVNDGSEAHPYSREQFAAMTRADYITAQERLGGTLYVNVGNYAYEKNGVLGNGVRNDTTGQVPDHSKLNAYGENGYLGEKNDGANGHAVVFVGGTITSDVTGYTSIDSIGTSLLLAVPAYTKVTFKGTAFKNVLSFDYQLYTSPWSQLGGLTFNGCTFDGIIVGAIASQELAFNGCTFNNYVNTTDANSSNPTWIRPAYGNWTKGDNEGQGTGFRSLTKITFENNKVTSTRSVKFERIAQWEMATTVTATGNTFAITPQEGDKEEKKTKNVGLYFGANAKFDLVVDKNEKSGETAALYTAVYLAPNGGTYAGLPAGSTVKNAAGEAVATGDGDALAWKTTKKITLKTTTAVASVTNAEGVSVNFATLSEAVKAAQAGETVTLLADITLASKQSIKKELTLDLNGKTLTGTAYQTLSLGSGANVTIQDSSAEKTGKVANGYKGSADPYTICLDGYDAAALTLVSGTVEANPLKTDLQSVAINTNHEKDGPYAINIKGGKVFVPESSTNGRAIVAGENVTLTVEGGEIVGGLHGVDVYDGSATAITGGSISARAVDTGVIEAAYGLRATGTASVTIGAADGAADVVSVAGIKMDDNGYKLDVPAVTVNSGTIAGPVYSITPGTIVFNVQATSEDVLRFADDTAAKFLPSNLELRAKDIDGKTMYYVAAKPVAAIGDEKYETLAEAIAAAKASKTVVMLIADTRENVIIDKRLTLDLNGFTLNGGTVQGKAALTVNATRVTIMDSSEAKTGMIKREDTAANSGMTSYYVLDIQGKESFVLFDGGTVINDSGTTDGARKGASLVRIGDDSVSGAYPQLTIKGGTFTQNNFVAIKVDRGTFYLTGGTINCPNDEAVKNWGAATIKGGTVNGTVASWVYADSKASSTLTISDDATVNGNVYAMSYDGAEGKTAKVSITGGYVTGELGTYQGKNIHEKTALSDAEKASIGVTGGRFTRDPSAYLAEDSTAIKGEDEIFSVQKAYLAKIGDTCYYTMDEAFHAANASEKIETIVLLRDYTTMALQNSGSKGFTLDLNGKTWTCKGSDANSAAFEINYRNVTLTVKNGKVVSDQLLGLIPSAMGGTITYDNAALVFEDVDATVNGRSGIETNGNNTKNSITLKRCSLTVADGYGIYFPSSGTLTIEDSVIVAKTMGVQVCAGTLSISGASKITVTGDAVAKVGNDGAIEDGAAVSVVNRMGYKALEKIVLAGGTFTAKAGNTALKAYAWANGTESAFDNAMGTIAISGGTFSSAVLPEYCAAGFIPAANGDGTFGVKATFEIVTVKTAVGAETTISVRIPNALMETVAGETRAEKVSNLSKADENGNLAWVNLVAGIDSTKKVTMAAPQNDDADVIDVDLPAVGTAPAGTDVTVRYEIRAEGSDAAVVSATAAEDLVINLNGQAGIGTYRTYVCLLQNGTEVARVASENALGVLQTVSAAKKTIIAVPWLSLADGGNISVANLVKTAGLTKGDRLNVYNKAEKRYDVYELTAGKAWNPIAIYKIGADGTVEAVSSGTQETTTVARGNGVWLERQDTAKAIVSYGQVASGTVATTIDAGTAEKPTWNLLAVPTTTAVNIATTFGASETDTLIVPTAGAPKICTVKDGAWGYEKAVSVTDKFGNQTGVRVVRKTVTELPAGTGFWYLNGGAAKAVNW